MNGRKIFVIFKNVIFVLSLFMKVIPFNFQKIIYNLISGHDGKMSLLYRYLYLYSNVKSCGKNVYISSNVVLKNLKNLEVGDNVSFHSFCYIDAAGGLKIENNVSIASHSSIFTFEHTWKDKSIPIKYNEVTFKSVSIGNDVWIGSHCVILGGVSIDSRSVVAAGSVVNRSVNHSTLVGGVPAKKIKDI